MNFKNELLEFYEKIYYHEANVKAEISQRLQIPSVIVISIISLYGFLIQGIRIDTFSTWHVIFIIILTISLRFSIIAILASLRALSGHSYAFLPTSNEIEDYRAKLTETYKEYPEQRLDEKYFSDYLIKNYNKCSTHNTIVNESRSNLIYSANLNIAWCIPLLALLFLIQSFTEINKSSNKGITKVSIESPVLIKGAAPIEVNGKFQEKTLLIDISDDIKELINDKSQPSPPPPPPPPPPERYIREDEKMPGLPKPPPTKPK
ncbi:hypothetical protein L5B14_00245 [Pseudomonas aeruginosa]|nr:hypothetical protein [Pseudomonas aeruginosa]